MLLNSASFAARKRAPFQQTCGHPVKASTGDQHYQHPHHDHDLSCFPSWLPCNSLPVPATRLAEPGSATGCSSFVTSVLCDSAFHHPASRLGQTTSIFICRHDWPCTRRSVHDELLEFATFRPNPVLPMLKIKVTSKSFGGKRRLLRLEIH